MRCLKAVRIRQFGGPEVLNVENIKRTAPAPNEIAAKLYASGVNPVDRVIREV